MEFNEKLQELRKAKGMTQEELAEALYVSRTAISKWESGRGYPSIDSLKAIAKFFRVTIDELLSGEELLSVAEEDTKEKGKHILDLVFGLLDCSVALLLFLPLFGQRIDDVVQSVSLLSMSGWLRLAYYGVVVSCVFWGVLTLALQNCRHSVWDRAKSTVSLTVNALGVLLFIVSQQPYAAALLFFFLAIKVLMLLKGR